MGKPRVIAETGAGQHGVATATAAALFGLECTVYMGAEDCRRQRLNVVRMQLLGAEVIPVESGTRTLKDAINEAMRDWVTNVDSTHYLIGSAMGPHPFPTIVRELQKVISVESRAQFATRLAWLGCPRRRDRLRRRRLQRDRVVRRVDRHDGRAPHRHRGGRGGRRHRPHRRDDHRGARGGPARVAVDRLVDDDGQVQPPTRSRPAWTTPGVGPEHAWLADTGRATYVAATDDDALHGFRRTLRARGHHPGPRAGPRGRVAAAHGGDHLGPGARVILTMSGRGDKDVDEVVEVAGWDVGLPEIEG
jgi:tryptophan synthase beta chain